MIKNPYNRFKLCVGGSGDAGFSSGSAEADSSYDSGAGSVSDAPGVSTYQGSEAPAGTTNNSAAYVGVNSPSSGGGFSGGFNGAGATAAQVAEAQSSIVAWGALTGNRDIATERANEIARQFEAALPANDVGKVKELMQYDPTGKIALGTYIPNPAYQIYGDAGKAVLRDSLNAKMTAGGVSQILGNPYAPDTLESYTYSLANIGVQTAMNAEIKSELSAFNLSGIINDPYIPGTPEYHAYAHQNILDQVDLRNIAQNTGLVSNLTTVKGGAFSNYNNQTQQIAIAQGVATRGVDFSQLGIGVQKLSNGVYIDKATGNPLEVGAIYLNTPSGIVPIPAAQTPQYQIAQNISLFGTPFPTESQLTLTSNDLKGFGNNQAYNSLAAAFMGLVATPDYALGTISPTGNIYTNIYSPLDNATVIGKGWSTQGTQVYRDAQAAATYNPINMSVASPQSLALQSEGMMSTVSGGEGGGSPIPVTGGAAYDMVTEMTKAGQIIDPTLYAKAVSEGYTGVANIPMMNGQIDYMAGRQTSPVNYLGEALNFPTPGASSSRTAYVPFGNQTQIKLENIAGIRYDEAGQVGFYQNIYDPNTGQVRLQTNLVSSGGRNSLQSGMFSLGSPETPYVVNQWGDNQPTSNKSMSTLGSEAYGGFVLPLDNRTVGSTGATLSTYSNPMNLANLVNPYAVNRSKAELPNEDLPWGGDVKTTDPFLMKMSGGEFVETDMKGAPIISQPTVSASTLIPQSTISASTLIPSAINPNITAPSAYLQSIGTAIQNTPILGAIYNQGAGVDKNTVSSIRDFVTTAPVLGNIALGGEVFAARGEYNYQGDKLAQSGYSSDLSAYEKSAQSYAANLTAYNKMSPTDAGIEKAYAGISSEYSLLTAKESALKAQTAPYETAGERYKDLSAQLVGGQKNEDTAVYGIAKPLIGIGEGYRSAVTTPMSTFLSPLDSNPYTGVLKSAAMGFIGVPGGLVETAGQSLVGGERTVQHLENFPALVVSGGAMTAESFVKNPVEFIAGLAGMFVLGAAAGEVGGRAAGIVSTRGMEYVPLKNIGYAPEGRYPLNPVQDSAALARSFTEGKLYPAPKEMAEGGAVPYLHGEGGVPVARLPNAVPGDITLWTALESGSRAKSVGVGEAYNLETSYGSEVRGAYGAPIAETYFTKLGSGHPQMVDFSAGNIWSEIKSFIQEPIKIPTVYSTVVHGVEAIPESVRATARGAGRDYTQVNEYVQARSAEVPAGQGYMPMLKAEYEAIVPDNTLIEVTGRDYYTKIGGFGDSHFLGTRVPIVEQRTIGFEPGEIASNVDRVNPGESYKPGQVSAFSYAVSPSALLSSIVVPSYPSQMGKSYGGSSRMDFQSSANSRSDPTETPAYQSHANSYVDPSSRTTLRSALSAVYGGDDVSYAPTQTSFAPVSTPYTSKLYETISSPISKPYSITSPPYSSVVTPPYNPKYTAPIVPFKPIKPLPFGLPTLPPSGMSGSPNSRLGGGRKYLHWFRYGQGLGSLDFNRKITPQFNLKLLGGKR